MSSRLLNTPALRRHRNILTTGAISLIVAASITAITAAVIWVWRPEVWLRRMSTGRLQAMADSNNSDPILNYVLTDRLIQQKNTESAFKAAVRAAGRVPPESKDPATVRLLGLAGYLAAQFGTTQQAEGLLARVPQTSPGGVYPLLGRGILSQRMGKPGLAVEEFRAAVKAFPRTSEGWTRLGTALLEYSGPEEAEAPLRMAVRLNPASPSSRIDLGEVLGQMRRFSEAATEFKEAYRRDPTSQDFRLMYATALASAAHNDDEYTEAHRELTSLIAQSTENGNIRQLLAGLQIRFGHLEEAVAELKSVVSENGQNRDAWFNLAWVYERLGDRPNAEACYQEFDRLILAELRIVKARRQVNRRPEDGRLHLRLSKILHELGNDREAYSELVRAAELSRADADIQRLLTSARAAMGQQGASDHGHGNQGVGH